MTLLSDANLPVRFRGPFLEGPEKISHPESRSKISKVMITELFYSRILKYKQFLFTQEVSGVHTSPFSDTDKLKMALRARTVSGAFEKRVPGHSGEQSTAPYSSRPTVSQLKGVSDTISN